MKACIMCGGEGTRLRPLTFERPKPAIPLLNKPSIVRLVEFLADKGFTDVVLTLGYMGEQIERGLGSGNLFGVHIDYVYEKKKLGTAGSVKNAQDVLGSEPFLVVGGDHILNLNLRELYRFHTSHKAMLTVGLVCIDNPREFGIVDMSIDNNITRFKEKPMAGEMFSNLASTGIYACNPELLELIPDNRKFDFAYDLFPLLIERQEMSGYLVSGHWTDVGSPEAYRDASKWMLEGLTETVIEGELQTKGSRISGKLVIEDNVKVGANTSIVGPVVIGSNTTIGDRVLIGPYTTIGSGCTVGDGSKVLASYIYDDVSIGEDVSVFGSIIDCHTTIGRHCSLETGTVIGPRVVLDDEVVVHSERKIWPDVHVKKGRVVSADMYNENFDVSTNGS